MSTQPASLKQRGQEWVARARELAAEAQERWSVLERLVRTFQHYGEVLGNQLAGAITYFGFLSFFPLVALAFAGVGLVIDYVPDAQEVVSEAIESALPGMVGTDPGQIDVQAIARRRAGVGIVGLLGLFYAGLGWVSALRASLRGVFSDVLVDKRNYVVGKLIDVVFLGVIGVILVVTVALSTAVGAFTRDITEWLGIAHLPGVTWALRLAVILVGIAANTVLFFTMYKLLPRHNVPSVEVWQGALIAATGFEILKQLANLVIANVTDNALYGAFAIMVALLVWINYFGRLAILGACWAAVGGVLRIEEAQARTLEPPPPQGRGIRTLIGTARLVGVLVLVAKRGQARRLGTR